MYRERTSEGIMYKVREYVGRMQHWNLNNSYA